MIYLNTKIIIVLWKLKKEKLQKFTQIGYITKNLILGKDGLATPDQPDCTLTKILMFTTGNVKTIF